MTVSPRQRSERAQLDPFEALSGDVPPRDQRDLMAHPFFSLSKSRRVAPIHYKAGDVELQVYAVAEHGMATIWDADVLIWAASQILAAQDRGLPTSRFFRFTPYQLLNAIGRTTGARSYFLIKGALTRLQSTVIRTNIRHGEHWRRQQFSWINEWEELATRSGRVEGMEFVLPEWLYQGIVDRRLVLAIDPDYFALAGGIVHAMFESTVWPTPQQSLSILLLGIGPTGLAFLAWDHATKHGNLPLLGALSYFAPLLSTLLLIVAGYAPATLLVGLSALLIVGGALLASARRSTTVRPEATSN